MLVWTLNLEPHTCQASAILLSYPQHNPVLTKLVPNALVWYKISHKKIFKVFLTNQYSSKISIVVHTFISSLFSSLKLLSSWYGTKVCRWDSNIKADYTITQKPEEYKWNSYHVSLQNLLMSSVTSKKSSVWCVHTKSISCGIQPHSWHFFLAQHGIHVGILYRVQGSSSVSERTRSKPKALQFGSSWRQVR